LNRSEHIQQTALLQRRYESKYFPKVKAVIQSEVDHVAGLVQHRGIHEAMNYLHGQFHSKGLPAVIDELYQDVGLKFAARQQREFNEQRRTARKSVFISTDFELKSFQVKGFGFNAEWAKFIKDFLQRFLLDKITFDVATTTRDTMIRVLTGCDR
jgi:hypothetical protein